MKLKNLLITSTVLVGVFIFSAMAFASPSASILYNETDLGGGSYKYDYTFYNTSTAGESLYKVFFYFNETSTATGSPLPSGWFGTVWVGTNTNTFLNTMAISPSLYIAPSNSLNGFTFNINHKLGDSSFVAEFKNNEGSKYAFSGTTAVAVVPEPLSTILFVIGGAILAVSSYSRRRFEKKRVKLIFS